MGIPCASSRFVASKVDPSPRLGRLDGLTSVVFGFSLRSCSLACEPMTARNSSPNWASFASPTPEIRRKLSGLCGMKKAICCRGASPKMT